MIATPKKPIRVIDLTMFLSGPYCTWLLSTMGADVIKVERPNGGDPVRGTGPFVRELSTYFSSVNRNKRSIALDLKSEKDKLVLRELLKTADVLVENFRPGVLARLGFGAEHLKEINPNLIVASISGFGQTGSLVRRTAFDIVIQAMSGMISVTGSGPGNNVAVGVSIADISAGIFCALGIQSALLERERSGTVRTVDISMMDSMLALLEGNVSRFLNSGEVAVPTGTRHSRFTPFQTFQCADHQVAIAADDPPYWLALCKILRLDDLLDDERFKTNELRGWNYDALIAVLAPAIAKWPADKLLDELIAADIPCGPVNSIPEVSTSAYVEERQAISAVTKDGVEMKFVASPVAPRGFKERAAPALGEHSKEILAELNLFTQENGCP